MFYFDSPFIKGGYLAILITLVIYVVLIFLLIKLFERFDTISFKRKILLSIANLFISGLVTNVIIFLVSGFE